MYANGKIWLKIHTKINASYQAEETYTKKVKL